jgi:hypothetical protein
MAHLLAGNCPAAGRLAPVLDQLRWSVRCELAECVSNSA